MRGWVALGNSGESSLVLNTPIGENAEGRRVTCRGGAGTLLIRMSSIQSVMRETKQRIQLGKLVRDIGFKAAIPRIQDVDAAHPSF